MSVATVYKLVKEYPSFRLNELSFSLEKGRIAGFIGRNGAGKTTTIKAMLNLIHPTSGDISFFSLPLQGNETAIKQRIGYATGAVSWYPRKTIREIVDVTKSFYPNWCDEAFHKYLSLFELDENKTPFSLSEGMKVKLNLTLALSHRAELLILDEPTSGLDPFARDEITEVFRELKREGISIFFSTHIVSDLEKCADDILLLSKGTLKAFLPKEDFTASYSLNGEPLEDTILRLERSARNA